MDKSKINRIKDQAIPILKKAHVFRSFVFGSFATNKETEDSDLDIIVEFEGAKSLLDLVALKIKLEKEMKREVDVLTPDSISPRIYESIKKQLVRIL